MKGPWKPLNWYRELAGARGRQEEGFFIAEGPRAIAQIEAAAPGAIDHLVAVEGSSFQTYGYPVRTVSESRFRALSSTESPQGIMAVVPVPEGMYTPVLPAQRGSRVLLLEDVQDPGNTGTLIRTAAAFDYGGVILSKKCADPLSTKCVQSSAGTVLSLWMRRTEEYLELARTLCCDGYTLVAADLEGSEDMSPLRARPLLLALGNEAAGLSPALLRAASRRLRVPVARNKAESLNVAACGAICMYESVRE